MTYTVKHHDQAKKELDKLFQQNKKDAQRIAAAISSLAKNPRPPQSNKIKGFHDGVYSLKVGSHYRVLYEIQDKALRVVVLANGPTESVYDRLKARLGR